MATVADLDNTVYYGPKEQHTLDLAADDLEQLAADADDLDLRVLARKVRAIIKSIEDLRARGEYDDSTGGRLYK